MSLAHKTLTASIWSTLAEFIAKIISPAIFLILTRILSPNDFGIVAVATTILSFVYIVSDLGVSKVIVQISEDENLIRNYNAAFCLNVIVGIFFFLLVFFLSSQLASFYSQPESSGVIKVMSIQILFYSLSSVQNAIRRRKLDYKFLFYIRLITICTPLFISLPVAFLGGGYWAIVMGTIVGSFLNMIVLWVKSDWRPSWSICWENLRSLLGRSVWNTIEQICVWIPVCIDTYIIAKYLHSDSLGLYTTSKTLFSTIIGIVFTPILPVLFSALSHYHSDKLQYKSTLLYCQKLTFLLAGGICISVFIFDKYIVDILFSKDWKGLSVIMGIMFVIMGLESFYSAIIEGVRAKGYFKEIAINTLISILIAIPILFYAVHYGLLIYVVARSLCLYIHYPGMFWISKRKIGVSFRDCIINCRNIIIVFCLAVVSNIFVNYNLNDGWQIAMKLFVYVLSIFILWMIEKQFIREFIARIVKMKR